MSSASENHGKRRAALLIPKIGEPLNFQIASREVVGTVLGNAYSLIARLLQHVDSNALSLSIDNVIDVVLWSCDEAPTMIDEREAACVADLQW